MGLLGDVFKVGASIIGGNKQKKASKKAVAALTAAGNQAIGTLNTAFDTTAPQFTPYQEAGTQALGSLKDLVYGDAGTIAASPDYQFRVNEGQRSLGAVLRNTGLTESGAAMKEAIRFGQDMGAGEYDARFRRLGDLVNGGYRATTDLANLRMGNAGNVGDIQMDIGNAKAGGLIQRGNISAGQIQSVGNFLGDAAEGIASGGLSSLAKQFGIGGKPAGTAQGSSYQPMYRPSFRPLYG